MKNMKMFSNKSVKKVNETPFSKFIRSASPAEKKRVYTHVLKNASERQNKMTKRAKSD